MPARAPDPGFLDDLADAAEAMGPDELKTFAASLDPADLAVLEQAMAQRLAVGWRSSPATMAHYLDPTFRIRPYVELLAEKFKQACDGTSKRQVWNLQGRLGKSLLSSQWGPVWQFDRRPDARFILVSYGAQLALENAVGIRDRLRLYSDELRCQLRTDRGRQNRFVTDAGGGVVAAALGGQIRGFGAGQGGGIIIDDPFKNWQEAHSTHTRDSVWNNYRGTLLDRQDDADAFIIVVHHRVHEDDLTGRLLVEAENGGEQWDHVVIPALAHEHDVLGRAVGEPVDPERFPVDFIEQQRRSMGSYVFSALYDQNPAKEEGTELLRAWFDLYETPPHNADAQLTAWDLKLKDREAGDFVVGQLWWRTGPDYWLRDQLRGRWDHATTANAIALMAVRHPECKRHIIEAAGSADEVVPRLRKPMPGYEVSDDMAGQLGMTQDEREQVAKLRRRGMSGLTMSPVKGDKSVRARMYITGPAEAGNVHLPAYAEYTPHLLDEIAAFPNSGGQSGHDDQIDAMGLALAKLDSGGSSITPPTGRRPDPPAGNPMTTVRQAQPRRAAVRAPGGPRLPGLGPRRLT